jgi:hypothetical protein
MTAAISTRTKRRLNRVMAALNFEYPHYERLHKGAKGVKRKIIVSILSRQAARLVKEDENILKKAKSAPKPKAAISKKRKLDMTPSAEPKVDEIGEEAPSTPSTAKVAEILKVMTDSLRIKLLSPLGLELTKFLQKKDQPLAGKEKAEGQNKRRIVNVMQAIERTLPSASAPKMVTAVSAKTEAATEAAKLATIMSGIDKLISDMVVEETVVTAKENMAIVLEKGKKVVDTSFGEKGFDLWHLGGQELSEADKEELKEYGISCGYQSGSMLFGGVDEEILGCIHDRAGAKIIGTLSKNVGFPKLECDISGYRQQHIVGSLFYSNFKVKSVSRFLLSL